MGFVHADVDVSGVHEMVLKLIKSEMRSKSIYEADLECTKTPQISYQVALPSA